MIDESPTHDPELLKLLDDIYGPDGNCSACGQSRHGSIWALCECYPELYPLVPVELRGPENFVERVTAGLVVDAESELVDHLVDRWHQDAGAEQLDRVVEIGARSLHDHLGISSKEYAAWVEDPNAMASILMAYRMGLGDHSVSEPKPKIAFVTFLHPSEGLLIQHTLFAGEDNAYEMPWRRQHQDGRVLDPMESGGFKRDDFDAVDCGSVPHAPAFRVDVCGGYTQGSINDDGILINWGGACPVQGQGSVDGQVLYYRSRGDGWSVDIGEGGPDEFIYGEAPYIWPDGGWIRAAESEHNIRKGVAEWRAHVARKTQS